MGHGALLLGHNPPPVRDACASRRLRGTHYGACHEKEVEMGEWVCRLVPSAARVRFTASGTEATHLAVRLARAFTGAGTSSSSRVNFHGWHEGLEIGVRGALRGRGGGRPAPRSPSRLVSVLRPTTSWRCASGWLVGDERTPASTEPTGGHFGSCDPGGVGALESQPLAAPPRKVVGRQHETSSTTRGAGRPPPRPS